MRQVQVSGVRRQRLDPRGPGLPASVQTKPPTAARTRAPELSSADQGVSCISGARRMHTRTASNNRHSAVLPVDEKGSIPSAAAPITSCAAPSRHLVAGHVRSRKFRTCTQNYATRDKAERLATRHDLAVFGASRLGTIGFFGTSRLARLGASANPVQERGIWGRDSDVWGA